MSISNSVSLSSASPAVSARRPALTWQRYLARADQQAGAGRWKQAVASLERAIAAGGDPYNCTLRIAEVYRAIELWPMAMEAAEKAVTLAPRRLLAYEAITAIALQAGDYERAIAASNTLIKLSPRHLAAYNALGAAYLQMGQMDAAMRVANTLIRLDPQTSAHHFKKALLCQHKNEVALAVHEFTEALRLDPDGPHADAALEALETLDHFQLNQILTLAMEDSVFRAKLLRSAPDAAAERGFCLSETGSLILTEICSHSLPEWDEPCRPQIYN